MASFWKGYVMTFLLTMTDHALRHERGALHHSGEDLAHL